MRYKFVLFILISIALARFCHYTTDGFTMEKVRSNTFVSENSESPPFDQELVREKFYYLARGKESFAFVSQDGKRVLKLFNNRLQRKRSFYRYFPFFSDQVRELEKKLEKKRLSYELADKLLHNETALIYTHLYPTNHLKSEVTLVDKLGIEHRLNLDETGFVVQKKAELIYPALLECRKRGEGREVIFQLVTLLALRHKKGIADNDPLLRTNCGFIDGTPVLLDLGPFSQDARCQNPGYYIPEILRITESLKTWLQIHYPERLPDLEEALSEIAL